MDLKKVGEHMCVSDRGLCGYLYTSSMSHGREITLAVAALTPVDSSTGSSLSSVPSVYLCI